MTRPSKGRGRGQLGESVPGAAKPLAAVPVAQIAALAVTTLPLAATAAEAEVALPPAASNVAVEAELATNDAAAAQLAEEAAVLVPADSLSAEPVQASSPLASSAAGILAALSDANTIKINSAVTASVDAAASAALSQQAASPAAVGALAGSTDHDHSDDLVVAAAEPHSPPLKSKQAVPEVMVYPDDTLVRTPFEIDFELCDPEQFHESYKTLPSAFLLMVSMALREWYFLNEYAIDSSASNLIASKLGSTYSGEHWKTSINSASLKREELSMFNKRVQAALAMFLKVKPEQAPPFAVPTTVEDFIYRMKTALGTLPMFDRINSVLDNLCNLFKDKYPDLRFTAELAPHFFQTTSLLALTALEQKFFAATLAAIYYHVSTPFRQCLTTSHETTQKKLAAVATKVNNALLPLLRSKERSPDQKLEDGTNALERLKAINQELSSKVAKLATDAANAGAWVAGLFSSSKVEPHLDPGYGNLGLLCERSLQLIAPLSAQVTPGLRS